MGEKITRSPRSADRARAKRLREALERNAPALSLPSDRATSTANEESSLLEAPELQKAYLEQLLECAPEAISLLNVEHEVLHINSEFTRVFGYTIDEIRGRSLGSVIVPPDRAAELSWLREMLHKGQDVSLETKRQRKDGSLVDVFASGAPVVIAGKQVGVWTVYRDISEEKRAQALSSALLRIAEKASSAEDLQQFYAAVHNVVAELMYARNFYIALYDPGKELLSFPYFVDEVDPRPDPKKLGKGLTEYVLRTGEPLLCTPEVFDRLVEQGDAELIGAPSLDWLGAPLKVGSNTIGVVVVQSYSGNVRFGEKEKGILTFVSQQLASAIEHKRNEEALRRSEARYRSLIQSAAYGIYCSSPDGKFLDMNPALIAMLGYESVEEVLALEPARDVFVDGTELASLMGNFEEGTRLNNVEVRWKRKDGKVITVRLSGRVFNNPHEKTDVLEIIAEDVTEQRVLENQFRQAQKMEAVGRLAGGVAHDFNNLLTVISGYTEVLLEHTQAQDPLYPKIQAIHQATERATSVTRQLLAFSRKQMLELKVVDINAIVTEMERLLQPLIGENIKLETRLARDLGRTRAVAGQIEQVIMNLVVNSKDAMSTGGTITIQTGNVDLHKAELNREHPYIHPGPYVALSVIDSGAGMDKETHARIFEPFFTTKEKGKGTGLGLSTVYGIVKQSGGYILVDSQPNLGSTFRIYLPRVEEATEVIGKVEVSQTHKRASETVLLVEDEESVRQLVRELLEAQGYQILEAENGEEALRVAAEHAEIDLLITDVVMPGMSGRELSARLGASHPHTKLLYLSGYTEDAIVHEGVLDPGTAFLQKPFTLQTLSRKVREVLGSERAKA
ncbi:MAG TPA: PAS domain S-box protein [Terriglobales bacterium]|nr:PAS domain S-box protein [Terriglobales bacterium]